jgi:hypothetical protein
MKAGTIGAEWDSEVLVEYQASAMREIVRAVRSVAFSSVEIVMQNSRIVQIERKVRNFTSTEADRFALFEILPTGLPEAKSIIHQN